MTTSTSRITLKSFQLLRRRSKIAYLLLSLLQVLTNLLDVIGVSLVGYLTLKASGNLNQTPNFIKSALKALPIFDQDNSLAYIAFLAFGFFALKTLFTIFLSRTIFNFLRNEAIEVTNSSTRKYFRQNINKIQQRPSQETVLAFGNGVNIAVVEYLSAASLLISEFFLMMSLGFLLLFVNKTVAIGSLFYFAIVVLVLQKFISGRIMQASASRLDTDIKSGVLLQELIVNFRDVYTANKVDSYLSRFLNLRRNSLEKFSQVQLFNLLPKYILELALIGGISFLFLISNLTDSGVLDVTVFLAAGTRVLPSLVRVNSTINATKGQLANASLGVEFLSSTSINDFVAISEAATESNFNDESPVLEFESVSFTHVGRTAPAIRDVSFQIYRNEFIGIVGPSGSGKSTLFDLMLGLITQEHGKIIIGGKSAHEAHQSTEPKISLVSQNTGIFNTTVRQNLLVLPSVDLDGDTGALWDALRFADLEAFVRGLPEGLDTPLGELGSRFSGGQKQRLGLARAFLQKPDVLLLDEATSSLDASSENEISLIIEKLRNHMTVVTIAHRLSFIRRANRLFYFKAGELIAIDNFENLVKNDSSFAEQVKLMSLSD